MTSQRMATLVLLGWLLCSCNLADDMTFGATPNQVRIPQTTATPDDTWLVPPVTGDYTPAEYPSGLVDALPVMSGICFEAAYDAAGDIFVLESADAHINFYDLADNSQLCRQPVDRYPFNFSAGGVLAGTWSYGRGCTAHHTITAYDRNDFQQTIDITAEFSTEGDCYYELVQPFWVGIPSAQGYEISITVTGDLVPKTVEQADDSFR